MAERSPRKLAVILHADVVGSTALVRINETLAHERIQDAFHRFSKTIEAYGGVAHELRGDALVAEFERASDAVSAALAFQVENSDFNTALDDDIRPALRMGVSLGEVVIADNTITGEGVVLAQRLEQLAEVGGVCIQGAAYETVPQRLPFGYESLGEQEVKGFNEPVRAYAVSLKPGESIPAPELPAMRGEVERERPKQQWIVVGATAVLVIVGGGLAWLQPWVSKEELASIEGMAFPLPDKPSIAVLPFSNLSDDPKQEYFVDGMTEDLITDLSKLSGLFVIARNSVFTYKGKPVKVRQVAEELGVRYVLEGSVRRAGEQIRINAQLIDATTGGHVWAERYDRKLDNIFAVQNAITERIVHALELHLTDVEQKHRDKGPKTTSLEAYDLVLKARKLLTRFEHKAAAEARDLLQRAIEIDPAYSEAYSLLGFYFFDEWRVWGGKREQNLSRALELATTAVELSPSDPAPHVLLALVYQWRREFDAANAEADTALALQSNDAITLSNLGSMLNWANRSGEALDVQQQAIRLDPFHPPIYLERLADAYAGVGNYIQCIEAGERGVALDPNIVGLHVTLAECYAALGREEEARAATAEILRTNPRFTLKAYSSYVPYTDERDLQRSVDLLRKAGVPESADEVFRMAEGHMTGEQIRAAISGQTFVDTRPVRYAGTIMTFDTTGTIEGRPKTGSPVEQFGSDRGKWWIEGDRFCRKWNRWVSGRAGCFSFVRDGDSINWINRYGQFSSAMEKLD